MKHVTLNVDLSKRRTRRHIKHLNKKINVSFVHAVSDVEIKPTRARGFFRKEIVVLRMRCVLMCVINGQLTKMVVSHRVPETCNNTSKEFWDFIQKWRGATHQEMPYWAAHMSKYFTFNKR